ncbi:MAG: 3-hydroxybutyrate oligomer hydrolase family protein [Gammaproteobacteria bacterium]|nr:3-hydroxybutyrate oligomer hydrolase family protein [Gammaproteobacteria bacterium]
MSETIIVWESGAIERDGITDDLLTAGLGKSGLLDPVKPADASPRAVSIHKNFRELLDLSDQGGFVARFSSKHVEWKIPGTEFIALLLIAGRKHPFTVSVSIPVSFDWDRPLCIVAPSSGSRDLRGSIGDIGTWALANGCALVLTDKGTGSGAQVLSSGEVYGTDLVATNDPETPSSFRLSLSQRLRKFSEQHPGRIALKHAHSTENVEADWPLMVLEAVSYGRKIIERQRPQPAANDASSAIKVIAAGVSNGGGSVLRAAEMDHGCSIDGVVAVEPNLAPKAMHNARICLGDNELSKVGRPLMDYTTLMAMYLPCAVLSSEWSDQPFAELTAFRAAEYRFWSDELSKLGLLEGRSDAERSKAAMHRIRTFGFTAKSDSLQHLMAATQVWNSIAINYANAYGRFGVEDKIANATFAFATTDPTGQQLQEVREGTRQERRLLGALSGGLSPGGGVHTIFNGNVIWPSLDDILFLRSLLTGKSQKAKRVQTGVKETCAMACSLGHPTLIIHGRSDSLISPDHTSRAYFAAVSATKTDTRHWRYYEVDNAQHFEAFLMIPDISGRFAPWWPVFFQSLDLMRDHIYQKVPFPPSQVVRADLPVNTGPDSLAIRHAEHLPSIKSNPGVHEIVWAANSLHIPV